MKQSLKALVLFILGITAITACSEKDLSIAPDNPNQELRQRTIDNRVHFDEAQAYASIATKGDLSRITVEPIISVDGDTLMFFVNYEEGWKIL